MRKLPPLALLAGGLATRMRPLTDQIPKSMIEVAGDPFIAHQLRLLKREGVESVVICAGHLSEMIEAFVGDGTRFGLSVAYSLDGPALLGTGGALRRALPKLGDEFFVMYGDSYLDISFADVAAAFRMAGKPGLMTVFHNQGKWDASNVEFAGGRILAYSKAPTARMKHIDFGLALLRREVVAARPEGVAFDLAAVYHELVERGEMAGFEVYQRFYEIGSKTGLTEMEAHLSAQRAKEKG